MDLLRSVRKEGASRGGTGNFSWENVKTDKHRDHYLGHSVMAPVGRWQKNKDLQWYANAQDADGNPISEEDARKEEIRRVKEAENNAMAKALGYEPADLPSMNPNKIALGSSEVQKAIKESLPDIEDQGSGRAFGSSSRNGNLGSRMEDREPVEIERTESTGDIGMASVAGRQDLGLGQMTGRGATIETEPETGTIARGGKDPLRDRVSGDLEQDRTLASVFDQEVGIANDIIVRTTEAIDVRIVTIQRTMNG